MAEFQGYAQGGKYDGSELASVVPHMKEENARQMAAYDRYMAQVERNNQVNIKAAAQQGKDLQQLAKVSQQFGEMFFQMQEKQNEADLQEGLSMAYAEGFDNDVVAGFDLYEDQLKQDNVASQAFGFAVEQQTGNPWAGQRSRDLGGWKGYGYAMGMAQKGGTQYPLFVEQQRASHTVNIEGREVTYDTAQNPAERSMVEASIRKQFLGKYAGMNPLLLNKYLFPAMQRYEAQAALDFAEKRRTELAQQREDLARDQLYSGFSSGFGGQSVVDFIQANQAELGLRGARKAAIDTLSTYLQDDTVPIGQREAAFNSVYNQPFTRNDGHQTTLGKAFGRDFATLEQTLNGAQAERMSRRSQERTAIAAQYQDKFEEAVRAGKKFSLYDIEKMKADYQSDTGMPAPQFFDTYTTQEEQDAAQEKLILDQLKASRPGGYLLSSDLDGMSVQTRATYNSQARQGDEMFALSKEQQNKLKRNLRTWTNEKTGEQIGVEQSGSRDWNNMYDNAENAWNKAYADAIQDGATQQQAIGIANQQVEKDFNFGIKNEPTIYSQKPSASIPQQQQKNFDEARTYLQNNPLDYDQTVLPGTQDDLAALKKYRDTGKGDIPHIYKRLSNAYKHLTPYDFANAQLRAAGESELGSVPKAVELTRELSPAAQELINFKWTPARSYRAMSPVSYIDPGNTAVPARGSAQRPTLDQGFQVIQSMGVPERGAAYLAGNIMQESGWWGARTWGQVRGDGSDRNGGLVSWMDDAQRNHFRLKGIENYLGKPITQATVPEQLDAMMWEMKRRNPGAYATFMDPNASDADLRRASKQYWGYGHEGARYGHAKDLLTGNVQQSRQGISSGSSIEKRNPTTVVGASGYRGTNNVVDTGQRDYKGRPIMMAPRAAASWKKMIAAGMPTNSKDVANAYRDEKEYLRLRNAGYNPAADGTHNHGEGVDCHGAQGAWIRKHGAAFGWYPNDYSGTHGGHYEFKG